MDSGGNNPIRRQNENARLGISEASLRAKVSPMNNPTASTGSAYYTPRKSDPLDCDLCVASRAVAASRQERRNYSALTVDYNNLRTHYKTLFEKYRGLQSEYNHGRTDGTRSLDEMMEFESIQAALEEQKLLKHASELQRQQFEQELKESKLLHLEEEVGVLEHQVKDMLEAMDEEENSLAVSIQSATDGAHEPRNQRGLSQETIAVVSGDEIHPVQDKNVSTTGKIPASSLLGDNGEQKRGKKRKYEA
ncbi:hypothetical protein F4778DRAFT_779578 [Xylariomycetidae sp. FL2044]|nr:hypothetical protein F4778DRAFT_779578 [Xylariomycetidae sp. FL2044]